MIAPSIAAPGAGGSRRPCLVRRFDGPPAARAGSAAAHDPNGDPAAILDRALTLLLADLEHATLAATAHPRAGRARPSGSRHIPAAVTREVWTRDGGRCAFVGTSGRCTETGFLEFHPPPLFELRRGLAVALAKADHVRPYADGGATVVENLQLRCGRTICTKQRSTFGRRLPILRESRAVYRLGPDRVGYL